MSEPIRLSIHFHNLRNAYRRLVDGDIENGRLAIENLREFCRADMSCIQPGADGRVDTYATAVNEGRREVYLKIQQMLNLTDEKIMEMRKREERELAKSGYDLDL